MKVEFYLAMRNGGYSDYEIVELPDNASREEIKQALEEWVDEWCWTHIRSDWEVVDDED